MDRSRKKTVLVVDDEQAVRDLFCHTLEPLGFDVVAVANPDEGIETAKHIEPDIVYLSLLFPKSNGLKVGKSIHSVERLKDMPIVVLISYRGELDPKYTRTIGIMDVLVKPLKPADILSMTSRYLGEEISSEGDEVADVPEEEGMSDIVEQADLLSAGSAESITEEPVITPETAESEIVGVPDGIEEAGDRSDLPDEFTRGEGGSSADFGTEEKESDSDWMVPDIPAEGKEDDADNFRTEEGNRHGGSEEEGHDGEDLDPGDHLKTDVSSAKKYFVYAALVLLVAVAVFAAFQTGILPGGRKDKLLPATGEERPVKKETVKEVVQPENAEDKAKTEEVHGMEKNGAGKSLPASQSSGSRRSVKTSAGLQGETKALNEGLKEPKAFKGKEKKIYSVQVGAFGKESNAVSLAKKLREQGYEAFVEKGTGGSLYRVLVGSFDDYGKARSQSEVLLHKDGLKSVIYRH